MPEDLMMTYCRRICGYLRDRINAEIYVNGDVDEVVTDIQWGEFQFRSIISHLHRFVYSGISSEQIAEHIYKKYKSALLSEAFL